MSVSAIFIIAAVFVVLVVAFKFLLPSKLDIMNPPAESPQTALHKSSLEKRIKAVPNKDTDKVLFVTEDVQAFPMGIPDEGTLEKTIVSLGDPRVTKPSAMYWKGAKFELSIYFYISNFSDRSIRLSNIKAHVYHVSMYRLRPGAIVWAPKVELSMDNTADLSSIQNPLAIGESQPVHLVFETSVFDTLFTTLVFGLAVDFSNDGYSNTTYRFPSDRIYLFQHDHRWQAQKCHFVSRNDKEIDEVSRKTGTYKGFFESLKHIYNLHSSQGIHVIRN